MLLGVHMGLSVGVGHAGVRGVELCIEPEGKAMPPWSPSQVRVAKAVAAGWKPTGKAKGFTGTLADLILSEGKKHKKKARR